MHLYDEELRLKEAYLAAYERGEFNKEVNK